MKRKRLISSLLAATIAFTSFTGVALADKGERIYGEDRYETASKLSAEAEAVETVIVASGENYVDALTGGVFSNSLENKGQLFLSPAGELPEETLTAITDLDPEKIYIIGGSESISENIENTLGEIAEVERIQGQTRYQTSVAVAEENEAESNEFAIANGLDFPDAMVVSSVTDAPLLFVEPNNLPEEVKEYLEENKDDFDSFTVYGGDNSVSDEIIAEISDITGIEEYTRISGPSRYETAIEAANTKEDVEGLVVASGEGYADALIAGPYAFENDYALVFASKDNIPLSTQEFIKSLPVLPLKAIGGTNMLSDETVADLEKLMTGVMYHLGSLDIGGETAAEIVSYNAANQTMYVINGEETTLVAVPFDLQGGKLNTEAEQIIFDFPATLEDEGIDFTIGDVTSVSVSPDGDLVATSLQAEGTNENGIVVITNADNEFVSYFETGVQPDMLTFSPDGKYIVTADEGEPREGYIAEGAVDPLGSITVYNVESEEATVLDFTAFDEMRDELVADEVLLKPDQAVSQDLEPEYVAITEDSKTAYVSLQENNSIATVDLENLEITAVQGLGFKDHGAEGNELDMVKDEEIGIVSRPGFYGIYLPDAIDTYTVDGVEYILTANEGDAREWGEEDTDEFYANIRDIALEGTDEEVEGFTPDAYEGLDPGINYILGGRSFAIFRAEDMELVYDSGAEFERVTAEELPEFFNANNDEIEIDDRSDNKGPEPEGVVAMELDGKTYAFIGLERIGGIMMYDITDPENAFFVEYINTRDFSEDLAGDSGPEGLDVIYPDENDYGKAFLLASYEVSGTLGAYEINTNKITEE